IVPGTAVGLPDPARADAGGDVAGEPLHAARLGLGRLPPAAPAARPWLGDHAEPRRRLERLLGADGFRRGVAGAGVGAVAAGLTRRVGGALLPRPVWEERGRSAPPTCQGSAICYLEGVIQGQSPRSVAHHVTLAAPPV